MTRTTRARRLRTTIGGAAAAALLLAACGDDDDVSAESALADDAEATDIAADELASPQLSGLEVTVSGNVTETIDSQAFQIDKDGLGEADGVVEATDEDVAVDFDGDYYWDDYDLYDYYDYDYDFYDYDYYTDFDTEYDEFDETSVLVVTPDGSTVQTSAAVQVNGTLRYFDEETLESVYEIDLDDELYASYEDQYVIVADSVKTLPATRDEAKAGSTTTTTAPADGATSSTTEADDGSASSSTTAAGS